MRRMLRKPIQSKRSSGHTGSKSPRFPLFGTFSGASEAPRLSTTVCGGTPWRHNYLKYGIVRVSSSQHLAIISSQLSHVLKGASKPQRLQGLDHRRLLIWEGHIQTEQR